MTAYIANHQKKRNLLHKREQELEHALSHGFDDSKLKRAAEKVREAKLAVFKALFSQSSVLPPHSYEESAEAIEWRNMSVAEIIRLYRVR